MKDVLKVLFKYYNYCGCISSLWVLDSFVLLISKHLIKLIADRLHFIQIQ